MPEAADLQPTTRVTGSNTTTKHQLTEGTKLTIQIYRHNRMPIGSVAQNKKADSKETSLQVFKPGIAASIMFIIIRPVL
jgi:hypothetical protein